MPDVILGVNTAAGGNSDSPAGHSFLSGPHTSSINGTLSSLFIWVSTYGGPTNVLLSIYDSGYNLLGTTAVTLIDDAGGGFHEVPLLTDVDILSATNYFLSFQFGGNGLTYLYENTSGTIYFKNTGNVVPTTPLNPWGAYEGFPSNSRSLTLYGVVVPLPVGITYPNGGEGISSITDIVVTGTADSPTSVDLKFCVDFNGAKTWQTLADDIAVVDNEWTYTIPAGTIPVGTHVGFIVYDHDDHDVFDEIDEEFSIVVSSVEYIFTLADNMLTIAENETVSPFVGAMVDTEIGNLTCSIEFDSDTVVTIGIAPDGWTLDGLTLSTDEAINPTQMLADLLEITVTGVERLATTTLTVSMSNDSLIDEEEIEINVLGTAITCIMPVNLV